LLEYKSVHDPIKLLALDGFETTIVRFTTDIPYLTNWGTPLLIGPGSILDAHTEHERVAKSELMRAVDIYQDWFRVCSLLSKNRWTSLTWKDFITSPQSGRKKIAQGEVSEANEPWGPSRSLFRARFSGGTLSPGFIGQFRLGFAKRRNQF